MIVRPILFRDEMVRALLVGRKTQTRRVVKPSRSVEGIVADPLELQHLGSEHLESLELQGFDCMKQDDGRFAVFPPCPFGTPGDLLWVRETWALLVEHYKDGSPLASYQFRANGVHMPRWKPSIHMPRAASRLTLRVTGVRVERVQEISDADCIAEGAQDHEGNYFTADEAPTLTDKGRSMVRGSYQLIWDSMRAGTEYAWAANPWVWVIEFEAVRINVDDLLATRH